jgi:predicted TIM-barrel fold metal-dependent hydrolase
MSMPKDVGVIDLMMGIPSGDPKRHYEFLKKQFLDKESREEFAFPVEYIFKGVPKFEEHEDPIAFLLAQMDHHGIAMSMLGTNSKNNESQQAINQYPDRFFGSYEVDPNRGMEGVRDLERAVKELGVKAATAFPCGLSPQIAINDKKFYPIYAKCVELDIPICVCAGIPGPRVPFWPQDVAHIDEVCWFFPELKFVTRHGCEPWADLAVKLMLKWPNLYYSTSAFAPKHYPKDIIDYANTRGAAKVMYAGYYPMGLSLDRIFDELPDVPFRDKVWPGFLRDNAVRVFKLDG